MIFIGAGVPVMFGVPALIEMTDVIKKKYVANTPFVEQLELVVKSLEARGFSTDIENVLTVLEAIKDEKRVYSEIGPKVAALDVSGTIKKVADIDGLVTNIKLTIKELCMKPDYEKSDLFYKNLIDKIRAIPANHFPEHQIFQNTIVTTNYDLTIEEALLRNGFTVIDGFDHDRTKRESVFNSSWGGGGRSYNEINLVKLHGSIDYYKEVDGTIIRDESFTRIGRDRRREELVVYPAGEKSITSTPFYDLYTRFRAILFQRNVALCLGFSFRDFAIRNIFADWLSLYPGRRLIIYARSANRTRNLFPEAVRDQVITDNKNFNDPNFLNTLAQHVTA